MSIKMKFSENESWTLFLRNISQSGKKAENEILDTLRKEGKKIVVAQLKDAKRQTQLPKGRTKHMYQDVSARRKNDKYGGNGIVISGGKQTGTLWHIVNDGNSKRTAIHFMDKSMDEIDILAEYVIDNVLSKEFKDD